MGEVNVDDLKEGMVLAADLKDAKGRFLLGKGVPIESKHIRIMKIWGISAADIEGMNSDDVAQETMNQIDPQQLEEINQYLENRFAASPQPHEALKELKRLCILKIAQEMAKSSQGSNFLLNKADSTASTFSGTAPNENITPLFDLIEKNVQLSSFPDIYYQIMNVLNDTRSSATHLAHVISRDPGLSASLLKLVNSAFFALPARVDSITRAVALIGGREISALAMGISVIRFFKGIPPQLVDMKKFWFHSVACGIFARILAHRKVELMEETFFLGGLLHDIGRLIMFNEFPQTMALAIHVAKKRNVPLVNIELELLGYQHDQVTGLLLEKWNFPKPLQQMIRFHHTPLTSKKPLDSAIILISDIIATALELGYSGNPNIPSFSKELWDVIGLSPSVLNLSIKQAERQITETLQAFHLEEL